MIGKISRHVIVTRKQTGLGSDLVSVVGAIHHARMTHRDVVIDWRSSVYQPDRRKNLFSCLFQVQGGFEGVQIHVWDEGFADKHLPGPLLRCKDWSFENYHLEMTGPPRPVTASVIIERPMHHLPEIASQAEMFKCISPLPYLSDRIDAFHEREFRDRVVIGVHLRHGNGERLGQQRDELATRSVEVLSDLMVARIRQIWGGNVKIFVCSDSNEFRDAFCRKWPDSCHFGSRVGMAGNGPIHRPDGGLKNAEDAVAEMWLLARCQGIVYNPSWFSHYARATGTFPIEPQNTDEVSDYGTAVLYEKKFAAELAKKSTIKLRNSALLRRLLFWKRNHGDPGGLPPESV